MVYLKKISLLAVFSMMFLFTACEQRRGTGDTDGAATGDTMAERDTTQIVGSSNFLTMAASAGLMEVELGRIASKKAQSRDVRSFGQMMVTDHSIANDSLRTIAQRNNHILPDSMTPMHRAVIDSISRLTGRNFDRAYMAQMVRDHQQNIQMFENASNNEQDTALRQWASSNLLVLRRHHDRAMEIQGRLGGGTAGGGGGGRDTLNP